MIYFFHFFNKCSFWNLLLQIKCGTVLTVWGNGERRGGQRGLPFLCLHCVCVCVSRCVNVCISVCGWVEENVWSTIFDSQPSICVCFYACFWKLRTIAGISMRADTTWHTQLPFFLKREQAYNLWLLSPVGAKLNLWELETGISCMF